DRPGKLPRRSPPVMRQATIRGRGTLFLSTAYVRSTAGAYSGGVAVARSGKENTSMTPFTDYLNRISSFIQRGSSRRQAFALPFGLALVLLALPGSHARLAADTSPPPGTIMTIAGTGQN